MWYVFEISRYITSFLALQKLIPRDAEDSKIETEMEYFINKLRHVSV